MQQFVIKTWLSGGTELFSDMDFKFNLDFDFKKGGALWTVSELLFESNDLIPALQQMLTGG